MRRRRAKRCVERTLFSEQAKTKPKGSKARSAKKAESQTHGGVLLYRGREPTRSELSSRSLTEDAVDLIVVDESNMFSSRTSGNRKYLTVVCTRIPRESRRQYRDVVTQIPVKKGERSKYASKPDSRVPSVVKSIGMIDIEIVEHHERIDYTYHSDSRSKGHLYMKTVEEALDKAVELDRSRETDVIIDSVPLKVEDDLRQLGTNLHRKSGGKIRWFETRKSASDRYLTVHDFETGAVAGWIEGDEKGTVLFENFLRRRFRGGRS